MNIILQAIKSLFRDIDDKINKLRLRSVYSEKNELKDLIESDMLPAVHNKDGKILTDEKNRIILRY